jgi:Signal peptide binding domain
LECDAAVVHTGNGLGLASGECAPCVRGELCVCVHARASLKALVAAAMCAQEPSRVVRVARGSGRSALEVNALFEEYKRLAKLFQGGPSDACLTVCLPAACLPVCLTICPFACLHACLHVRLAGTCALRLRPACVAAACLPACMYDLRARAL